MDDYEHDYFMIRVPRRVGESCDPGVAGVAERLDTGEKHTFGSGSELPGIVRFTGFESPADALDLSIRGACAAASEYTGATRNDHDESVELGAGKAWLSPPEVSDS